MRPQVLLARAEAVLQRYAAEAETAAASPTRTPQLPPGTPGASAASSQHTSPPPPALAMYTEKACHVVSLLQQLRVAPSVVDAAVAVARPQLKPWLDVARARRRKAANTTRCVWVQVVWRLYGWRCLWTVVTHPLRAAPPPQPLSSPPLPSRLQMHLVPLSHHLSYLPAPSRPVLSPRDSMTTVASRASSSGSAASGFGAVTPAVADHTEQTYLLALYGALCACAAAPDARMREGAGILLLQIGADVGLLDLSPGDALSIEDA